MSSISMSKSTVGCLSLFQRSSSQNSTQPSAQTGRRPKWLDKVLGQSSVLGYFLLLLPIILKVSNVGVVL